MKFFNSQTEAFPLSGVSDYRLLAQKRLPRQLFDFIDGGAFNETTLRSNAGDYQRILLRKRVLKDVSTVDTSVEVVGQKLSQPLILAPVGFAGVYARRGEAQAALAAEKAGIPFSLSSVSICSMEEVRQASSAPFWYQYYLLKDREKALELLKKVEAAGCPVLLLTVDLPAVGIRHRYHRSMGRGNSQNLIGNGLIKLCDFFSHLNWYYNVRFLGRPLVLGDVAGLAPHLRDLASLRKWMGSQLDASMTWKDLEWIRARWPGKIVLKGISDPEDARAAVESGVDGIVVSNHGARHLDSTPSTISTLPHVVEAVGGRLDVLVDGGISSGLDVVKALAHGAKACLIGRAWAFALAARGGKGVEEVLNIFHNELKAAMVQLGVAKVNEIDGNILVK